MTTSPEQFPGYPRVGGRPGVRNHLLVLSATGLTGPTARRIAAQVPGALVICVPWDTGLLGEDRAVNRRALGRFVTHPNVGGVLIIGGNPPLVDELAEQSTASGRLVEALTLDSCGHDAFTLTANGVRAAARLRHALSRVARAPVPTRDLFLGLECGRSDPSSGLVSNPLLGLMADRVADLGGTAVIGETTEWLGAEHLLSARGATPEVQQAIREAVLRRERRAVEAGMDLLGNNPGPTNIAAGLSTIEEKSLGNIAKSGHRPIQSVLGYGEEPTQQGVHVMDAAAYAPESLTGFTVAGAQLICFTTGVGNSYVNLLCPTIKVSANPESAERLKEQLDFDAHAVFHGREALEAAADRLWATLLEVAGGALTWGEVYAEGDEVVSRYGAAL